MKLLALDTSSAQCSVAVLADGRLCHRAVPTARDHAGILLPMVEQLLAECGLGLRQLDGIAFGRGPGSFTGVRIAAAVTQGLALGAALPVLPVSSLRALAAQAARRLQQGGVAEPGALLACMDARMGEVYWGVFGPGFKAATEQVGAPDALCAARPIVTAAAGKGLAAWPQIAVSLQLPPARVLADAEPEARDIASLAASDLAAGARWLDAALAQPVYLRDSVVQAPPGERARAL